MAADKCGVTRGEMKAWLFERKDFGPELHSKWKHGVEAIPDKYLVDFLREQIETMRQTRAG